MPRPRPYLDSEKISLIVLFIQYYAEIELNKLLKQKSFIDDFPAFLLIDDVESEWLPHYFLCQDFLNTLPDVYFNNFTKFWIPSSTDVDEDIKKFIQLSIKHIINQVIEEKKLVNYVEEIIKIKKINHCNKIHLLVLDNGKLKLSCSKPCVGKKCIAHANEDPICFL